MFWRILPGIFLEDFSGHFFPTKMRRKNPARKSAKKSGGSKIKIREKSVLPKAGPKFWGRGCDEALFSETTMFFVALRPICCLHFGPVAKNSIFLPLFGGKEEDLRGTKKMQKLHQILVHFFGAIFTIKMGQNEIFCQNVGSRSV